MPHSLFPGEAPDADARWLVDNGTRLCVPSGGVLLREGEPAEAIFVVLEGEFAVSSVELEEDELPTLGRGEIAGGLAYVRGKPPRVTVRALMDAAVLRVPFARLDERARTELGFAGRLRERARDAEDLVRRDEQGRPRRRTSPAPRPSEPRECIENLRLREIIERLLNGEIGSR
jgi:CRP-like cAMP-binding protein